MTFEQVGHRTVDFAEVGKRFADFGLSIDQSALKDLNRIRNDIEHLYTQAPKETVRESIARAFPVVVDLFRLADEQPHASLGDAWLVMLDVRSLYQRELAECRKSFDGVDWRFNSMAEAALVCPKCKSHLVERKDTSKSSLEYADASCRACGADIPAQELIEASLKAHFEMESYTAIKEGGENPLHDCPECSAKAYITCGDDNGCVWCHTELGECLRCETGLTPDNVSWDNSDLCSYCDHIMSKDD